MERYTLEVCCGSVDDVLEAERTLYSTQMQLSDRRAAGLAAIAQVCVALGGGW